ncbi:hypothetical protein KI387_021586, partial [Taxus chinensis]
VFKMPLISALVILTSSVILNSSLIKSRASINAKMISFKNIVISFSFNSNLLISSLSKLFLALQIDSQIQWPH